MGYVTPPYSVMRSSGGNQPRAFARSPQIVTSAFFPDGSLFVKPVSRSIALHSSAEIELKYASASHSRRISSVTASAPSASTISPMIALRSVSHDGRSSIFSCRRSRRRATKRPSASTARSGPLSRAALK